MKNKTAIRVLEQIDYYLRTHTNESCEEEHTAIALAIKALNKCDECHYKADFFDRLGNGEAM